MNTQDKNMMTRVDHPPGVPQVVEEFICSDEFNPGEEVLCVTELISVPLFAKYLIERLEEVLATNEALKALNLSSDLMGSDESLSSIQDSDPKRDYSSGKEESSSYTSDEESSSYTSDEESSSSSSEEEEKLSDSSEQKIKETQRPDVKLPESPPPNQDYRVQMWLAESEPHRAPSGWHTESEASDSDSTVTVCSDSTVTVCTDSDSTDSVCSDEPNTVFTLNGGGGEKRHRNQDSESDEEFSKGYSRTRAKKLKKIHNKIMEYRANKVRTTTTTQQQQQKEKKTEDEDDDDSIYLPGKEPVFNGEKITGFPTREHVQELMNKEYTGIKPYCLTITDVAYGYSDLVRNKYKHDIVSHVAFMLGVYSMP